MRDCLAKCLGPDSSRPPLQALHNVTTLTRATTLSAFQTLSYISEGCIFIYVGLDTLDPIKWRVPLPCTYHLSR